VDHDGGMTNTTTKNKGVEDAALTGFVLFMGGLTGIGMAEGIYSNGEYVMVALSALGGGALNYWTYGRRSRRRTS
jgi:hypothetical protein